MKIRLVWASVAADELITLILAMVSIRQWFSINKSSCKCVLYIYIEHIMYIFTYDHIIITAAVTVMLVASFCLEMFSNLTRSLGGLFIYHTNSKN